MPPLYFDYQATTPLAPEVFAAMRPWLEEKYGNPHASHVAGREAAAAVEVARAQVAALLPSGGRLFFTSGATEALNWAIKGSVGASGSIALPDSEHAAVRDTAFWLGQRGHRVDLIPVSREGLVEPCDFRSGLVAAMLVNNEIGVIQPIGQLADAAHEAGALFLCDAVQAYGRVPIHENCDMVAISAHKIHGPKGIGVLWLRDGVVLEPLLHGGGQEGGLRSGTLSPALCAGFGAAAQLMADRRDQDAAHVETLWGAALAMLPQDWIVNGSPTQRYHGNLNLRRDGLDVSRLLSELRGIAFSAGSACASGSGRPSHVLRAIGLSAAEARSSVRLGFGRYTSVADVQRALGQIFDAAEAQRI
jgi:cysteine desulfurase